MSKFAVVVAVLGITLVGSAEARTANDVTTTYYADAAHKKWVGSVELTCAGGKLSYGRTSNYAVHQSDSCSDRRMKPAAYQALARDARGRLQICYARCATKYGSPQQCDPERCPGAEALDECNAGCNAQEAPQ